MWFVPCTGVMYMCSRWNREGRERVKEGSTKMDIQSGGDSKVTVWIIMINSTTEHIFLARKLGTRSWLVEKLDKRIPFYDAIT
jgi:hypothetical protein